MESYDNYSGHRKMSVVERFPLFGESVIGGSTVLIYKPLILIINLVLGLSLLT